MRHLYFETINPLEEAKRKSNIHELYVKDEEFTLKAQAEGKPYYKWDTKEMAELIYENGCNDTCKDTEYWYFVATWLSLTLKFVEDEKLQYYIDEFLAGRCHYLDEYYGNTIYRHMYNGHSPYVYVLYNKYLIANGMKMPDYIKYLLSYYLEYFTDILEKIPNDDGTKLVEVSFEDAQKYNGLWISPEKKRQLDAEADQILENLFRNGVSKND